MVDAMETAPDGIAPAPSVALPPSLAPVKRHDERTVGAAAPARGYRDLAQGVAATSVAAVALTVALLAWRRHKRRRLAATPSPVSIAARFAEPVLPQGPAHGPAPAPPPGPEPLVPPEDPAMANPPAADWTYQRTAFEAPSVQLTLEPVDLLPRQRAAPLPRGLLERLHSPGETATLYLSGTRDHPTLRHVGLHRDDFAHWENVLREYLDAGGEEGHLARWLLPMLLCQRAPYVGRREAAAHIEEAIMLCDIALDDAGAGDGERPWWRAQQLRMQLARIARLSGATRLLALRDLGSDADDHDAPALDAWVDVHLAWSGWLMSVAARARLDIADDVCARLAVHDEPHAARRRAEVMMRRAALAKGEPRLALLDHAHSLRDAALAGGEDPATLLLFARCSHERATLLPPGDAAEACAFALAHAFAAGEHPAWRIESLELRLAIQLTHDALPGQAATGDVATLLRRELADARALFRTRTA
ncbi:hypothetical protein VI08_00930 [Luteibacter yeojuensis]|uniref:Uncharacterized protein n=2 Tax=Luteibacter yeojuensis TaxID=345309 RepID=A0A0F3L1Q6_9GAMM|nr:hypothetical protein VI08_00930 [Luteibacter yeojuensis]